MRTLQLAGAGAAGELPLREYVFHLCQGKDVCLAEPLLGLSFARSGQGGMLGAAEAVAVPELPSTSSCRELHRQRGHAGSWPASAREGTCLFRPPPITRVLPGELRNPKRMLAKCP